MATKPVVITYDPNNSSTPWSSSEQPVTVSPGTTTITWTIQLASNNEGSIEFDDDPGSPGIKLTRHWPGQQPTGDCDSWSVDAVDELQPGDKAKKYHYVVNAVYTAPGSSTGERKKWDPDVEMDPP